MKDLGFAANLDTFEALTQAYAEPQRFYHNQVHIQAVLAHFDSVHALARQPEEVELAIWFHDAIYDPHSASNEKDSADWAARFMRDNAAKPEAIERVYQLIMATLHDAQVESADAKLLVDMDLSILGASDPVYDAFENDVRQEYEWVPLPLFKAKRKDILQGFLQREPLYQTDYFHNKLEAQAKANLRRTIALL